MCTIRQFLRFEWERFLVRGPCSVSIVSGLTMIGWSLFSFFDGPFSSGDWYTRLALHIPQEFWGPYLLVLGLAQLLYGSHMRLMGKFGLRSVWNAICGMAMMTWVYVALIAFTHQPTPSLGGVVYLSLAIVSVIEYLRKV